VPSKRISERAKGEASVTSREAPRGVEGDRGRSLDPAVHEAQRAGHATRAELRQARLERLAPAPAHGEHRVDVRQLGQIRALALARRAALVERQRLGPTVGVELELDRHRWRRTEHPALVVLRRVQRVHHLLGVVDREAAVLHDDGEALLRERVGVGAEVWRELGGIELRRRLVALAEALEGEPALVQHERDDRAVRLGELDLDRVGDEHERALAVGVGRRELVHGLPGHVDGELPVAVRHGERRVAELEEARAVDAGEALEVLRSRGVGRRGRLLGRRMERREDARPDRVLQRRVPHVCEQDGAHATRRQQPHRRREAVDVAAVRDRALALPRPEGP
jgi:hypothetical protein